VVTACALAAARRPTCRLLRLSPHAPPRIIAWFVATTLIVSWDSAYSLGAPWSRDPTDPVASRLFAPYQQTYSHVDRFYGSDEAFAAAGLGPNAFGVVQSQMNLVELVLNGAFLALAARGDARARAVGLVVSTMTAAKTVTYFAMCNAYGWARVVPSAALATAADVDTFVRLFLLPNGVWIVVPTLVAAALAGQLSEAVRAARPHAE